MVTDARTLGSRRGRWGPSLPISRQRATIMRKGASPFRFQWLLSHEYNPALCKVSLPFDSGSKLSGEKKLKELPDDVWESVGPHVDRLKSGTIAGVPMPTFR